MIGVLELIEAVGITAEFSVKTPDGTGILIATVD